MTPPRFYAPKTKLTHDFWVQNERLVQLWQKLGYSAGQEFVLFDGIALDRLYRLEELTPREAHLVLVTDFERKIPPADTYILWQYSAQSSDDILKQYTAHGATHFLPLIAEPQTDTGFDQDQATKIVIEASEKSGRSDVPSVRQPVHLETALQELRGQAKLFFSPEPRMGDVVTEGSRPVGYLVTSKDGWSPSEQKLLQKYDVQASLAC